MTTPPMKAGRRPRRSRALTTLPTPARPRADQLSPSPPGDREGADAVGGRERGGPTVVLAAVAGAHGVGGEVRLKLFTADLSPYRRFNDGALTLTSLRGTVARFAEVPDRTAAEALRGTALTVPRAELPPLGEGEYYHADLIGLPVRTSDGEALGYVVAVENFGAGDILEIERPTGKRFMVPITAATIGAEAVIDSAFVD